MGITIVADRHRAVAAAPELLTPAVKSAQFASEVAIEMALEAGHLTAVLGSIQEVDVRRDAAESEESDVIVFGGPSYTAE